MKKGVGRNISLRIFVCLVGTELAPAADPPGVEIWNVYPDPDREFVLPIPSSSPVFEIPFHSERDRAIDEYQKKHHGDPPSPQPWCPPPLLNSAVAGYTQLAGKDPRFVLRIIPEMNARANILQTRLRSNIDLGYIESRPECAKLLDQSVNAATAHKMANALLQEALATLAETSNSIILGAAAERPNVRDTLVTLAAINNRIRYGFAGAGPNVDWRQEMRTNGEYGQKSLDAAKKAATRAVKGTLADSDRVLRRWQPSLEFIQGVVDQGTMKKRLNVNDDDVDGLCTALGRTVTTRDRVERVRRDCLPKVESNRATQGLRQDMASDSSPLRY
jgi:hypothetical protein